MTSKTSSLVRKTIRQAHWQATPTFLYKSCGASKARRGRAKTDKFTKNLLLKPGETIVRCACNTYTDHRLRLVTAEPSAMNQTAEPILRNPFGMESNFGRARHIPILPSSTTSTNFSQADIMDITPPASASMIAPTTSSPEAEGGGQRSRANHNSQGANGSHGENGMNSVSSTGANGTTLSAAAAASSQQPKVVQTAFIHKLYK